MMARKSAISRQKKLKSKKILRSITKHYEKILGLIIGIAFIGPYGFGDDYAAVENTKAIPEYILKSSVGQGRPILGIFAIGQFRFIDTFSDFIFLHVIQMIVFTFTLTLLRHILKLTLGHQKHDIEIGILISFISTAGTLTLLGWGVQLGPLSAIAISLAAILKILSSEKTTTLLYACVGLPIVTYQPAFVLVVTMFGLILFFAGPSAIQNVKDKFITLRSLITFTVFMGIEISCLTIGKELGWTQGERGAFVSNIPGKINWIIEGAIPQGLRFSGPWVRSNTTMFAVTLLVLSGMLFSVGKRYTTTLPLLTICIFALVPSILISENWASNRSMMSIQFIFSFFSIYGAISMFKYFTFGSAKSVILARLLIILILSTNSIYLAKIGWRDPQMLEIAVATKSITAAECKSVKSIRPSGWQQALGKFVSMDEYGIPSSTPTWSVKSFTNFICKEKGINLPNDVVIVDRKEIPNEDPEKDVIDFQQILNEYASSRK